MWVPREYLAGVPLFRDRPELGAAEYRLRSGVDRDVVDVFVARLYGRGGRCGHERGR